MSTLYVVATPIGNLEDMVPRAVKVLQKVDYIAAEDTRHSARLLQHFSITTPMMSYHDYSDQQRVEQLLKYLAQGKDVALISDAGTPLISDPGYRLVRDARLAGYSVVPIPGASALIAALSVSGLASDRFCFEGFLPAKSVSRLKRLEALANEVRTLVFYESPHRVLASLCDMATVFGELRQAFYARELSKQFETTRLAQLADLRDWVGEDANQQRGEIVIVVQGAPASEAQSLDEASMKVVTLLAAELPPKKAATLAAELTGVDKKTLYQYLVNQA